MSDYIPGWAVAFPEPEQWNGDDERPMPSAGHRRTRDDVARCYYCGEDTDARPSLDGHTFCSRACLDAWVRR